MTVRLFVIVRDSLSSRESFLKEQSRRADVKETRNTSVEINKDGYRKVAV